MVLSARYEETYGITTDGDSLTLRFVTEGPYSTNIGSRTYLMETEDTYQVVDPVLPAHKAWKKQRRKDER